jgi:hypothetical protein
MTRRLIPERLNRRGFSMPTTIALPQPKFPTSRRFLLQRLILGVPLAVWAIMMLLIAISAHFDAPVMAAFEAQELVPF